MKRIFLLGVMVLLCGAGGVSNPTGSNAISNPTAGGISDTVAPVSNPLSGVNYFMSPVKKKPVKKKKHKKKVYWISPKHPNGFHFG